MSWRRLSLKLMTTVGAVALVTVGVLAWFNIRTQRHQSTEEVVRGASQFSDTVRQSIHYAMLKNQWQTAFRIMDAIGQQEGVKRVRIFNKEGLILFSSDRAETGTMVNKRAEACYACHAAKQPLERLPIKQRSRTFEGPGGERILGMITPIYNEPSCSSAACHAHPPRQRVLGVLDVALSLRQVDEQTAATARKIGLQAGLMVVVILVILGVFLQRGVIRPVRELVEGTQRVTHGDLGHVIPIRSKDEIGLLAASFNEMTAALQRARENLAELVGTLEERVEERTRALKQTQAQLVQSEKLASLGKLAASIAHEINNPLMGILTYAKLLARRLEQGALDEPTQAAMLRNLQLVQRETERCTTIVRNLLDFARQREPAFKEVDLNAALGEALSLLAHRIEMRKLTIVRQLGEVPPVRADFDQLRQVFVNVALNACEAMEPGGTLTVSSRLGAEAGMAEAEIADTGPGIPPEHLERIFEPFFTTKERGTGLGLSVVYGIVERHGGRIDIASPPGGGTHVTIRIPLAAPGAT